MRVLIFLLLALLPIRAECEEVIAGLSQSRVAITTGFTGSEIFIYGAIKREAPPPVDRGPLDVVVVVIGPSRPVIVRKKDREFGIWINGPGLRVDAAPSFYAVSTTRPFRQAVSWTDDMRYRIGLGEVIRLIDAPLWAEGSRDEYLDAVVRLRRNQGIYFEDVGGVTVAENTLFQTTVTLPAQLVEGEYKARIFLTRDREVLDVFETSIAVQKVGLERWLYTMAKENGAIYGILSILVALAAGWLASTFFRIAFP